MKAKDTVMSDKELAIAKHPNLAYASCSNYSLWVEDGDRRIAEPQAAISFPAGEKQGYEKGFKAGLKEVVEWLRCSSYSSLEYNNRLRLIQLDERNWEDKLKEWGIE